MNNVYLIYIWGKCNYEYMAKCMRDIYKKKENYLYEK